jgi:hypothetical protein
MKRVIFIILLFTLSISLWSNELRQFNTKIYGDYPSFGRGNETVYIYYYDTYRYVGDKLDQKLISTPLIKTIEKTGFFPCKVGMTENLFNRLRQQNAAMPEKAIIPFIIKTSWASELETLLHMELYERQAKRKWVTAIGGGGHEWFLTNPQEIYDIANEYGQIEGQAKKILKIYHEIRTNWGYYLERFKHYYPEIKNPNAKDFIFKDPKDRIKKYGEYKEPVKTKRKKDERDLQSYKIAQQEVKEFIKSLDKNEGMGV